MKTQLISMAVQLPVLLSEARDFLKISHQDEGALIASYIRAATTACETFTARKLISQQWQLTLNNWRGDGPEGVIQIPLSPLLSIDKIEVWTTGAFQVIAPANYLLDNVSYLAKIVPQTGYQWPEPETDVAGISITVSAGFGDSQNDVPPDIRLGLLHWLAAAYDGGQMADNQAVLMAEKLWQPYRRLAL
ncbi:MAG: hypothetical protein COB54_03550 [Alphaproteobacteria bacterium]|nr:MAG: hypothetical protein COB54_03550 [Alphaproteobacteria bacterium]